MSSLRKFEWNLISAKIWHSTDRANPVWRVNEVKETSNNLILKHEGPYLMIRHNNEVIERIPMPIPGQLGSLVVTVDHNRDKIAIYTGDKDEGCRMGLTFAATSEPPFTPVQSCETFVAHFKKFAPIRYARHESCIPTVPVQQVFQELMSGQETSNSFPAGAFVPPHLHVTEAIADLIADPRFPEMMGAIHECFERLNR